ncbi:hypothetical protein BC827DRAFT_1209059 [Russula dissimulans]|nr:hypothetical protein BC827DRAFT_1209059 [Russula dissimulans]
MPVVILVGWLRLFACVENEGVKLELDSDSFTYRIRLYSYTSANSKLFSTFSIVLAPRRGRISSVASRRPPRSHLMSKGIHQAC